MKLRMPAPQDRLTPALPSRVREEKPVTAMAIPANPYESILPLIREFRSVHVVRQGESLYSIARDKLGAANRWKELLNWNSATLTSPDNPPVGVVIRLEPPLALAARNAVLPWGIEDGSYETIRTPKTAQPLTAWDRRIADASFVRAQADLEKARTEEWFEQTRRSRELSRKNQDVSPAEMAARAESHFTADESAGTATYVRLKDGTKVYSQPFVIRSRGKEFNSLGSQFDELLSERWKRDGNLARNAREADYVVLGEYWVEGATVLMRSQIYQGLREVAQIQWRLSLGDLENNTGRIERIVSELNEAMR